MSQFKCHYCPQKIKAVFVANYHLLQVFEIPPNPKWPHSAPQDYIRATTTIKQWQWYEHLIQCQMPQFVFVIFGGILCYSGLAHHEITHRYLGVLRYSRKLCPMGGYDGAANEAHFTQRTKLGSKVMMTLRLDDKKYAQIMGNFLLWPREDYSKLCALGPASGVLCRLLMSWLSSPRNEGTLWLNRPYLHYLDFADDVVKVKESYAGIHFQWLAWLIVPSCVKGCRQNSKQFNGPKNFFRKPQKAF